MKQQSSSTPPGERRNYYRILNVQPDAPIEIIKNNYRTMMQKLRLHPDLGGNRHEASIINEAYQVLSDTSRRAEYDKQLLAGYGIETLSRGNLGKSSASDTVSSDRHGNHRNYYRVLNVMPDSPVHIIKTSYLLQKKNGDSPLLNEAYSVLGNTDKRKLYDRLLEKYHHADAVKLLQNTGTGLTETQANKASGFASKQSSLVHKANSSKHSGYKPVITQYCSFCKTPHKHSPCEDTAPLCIECQSPLFPPSTAFMKQNRRDIVRLAQRHGDCHYYTRWPGARNRARIADLSPVGMQLHSSMTLDKNQLVKIDSGDFKAVGVVTHTRRDFDNDEFSNYAVGIKFITVNFNKLKGQFFSASA